MHGMGYEHRTLFTVSSLLLLESQPLWSYFFSVRQFCHGLSLLSELQPWKYCCLHFYFKHMTLSPRKCLQAGLTNRMLFRVLPSHWVKVRLLL